MDRSRYGVGGSNNLGLAIEGCRGISKCFVCVSARSGRKGEGVSAFNEIKIVFVVSGIISYFSAGGSAGECDYRAGGYCSACRGEYGLGACRPIDYVGSIGGFGLCVAGGRGGCCVIIGVFFVGKFESLTGSKCEAFIVIQSANNGYCGARCRAGDGDFFTGTESAACRREDRSGAFLGGGSVFGFDVDAYGFDVDICVGGDGDRVDGGVEIGPVVRVCTVLCEVEQQVGGGPGGEDECQEGKD